jgi:hypothetical protein
MTGKERWITITVMNILFQENCQVPWLKLFQLVATPGKGLPGVNEGTFQILITKNKKVE